VIVISNDACTPINTSELVGATVVVEVLVDVDVVEVLVDVDVVDDVEVLVVVVVGGSVVVVVVLDVALVQAV
jgi:hypothetical protein